MSTYCFSCRRSEIREPAVFAVRGRLNSVPYRANLCDEHLTDLVTFGGLEVRACRRLHGASATQLEAAYRRLLATTSLDAAGLARLDAARELWWVAATRWAR